MNKSLKLIFDYLLDLGYDRSYLVIIDEPSKKWISVRNETRYKYPIIDLKGFKHMNIRIQHTREFLRIGLRFKN